MESELEFEWDEGKRDHVIREHGIDFVLCAAEIFGNPNTVVEPDTRKDYGEDRYWAFGIADGMHICICFTMREDKTRLITAFQIHQKQWDKHNGKDS